RPGLPLVDVHPRDARIDLGEGEGAVDGQRDAALVDEQRLAPGLVAQRDERSGLLDPEPARDRGEHVAHARARAVRDVAVVVQPPELRRGRGGGEEAAQPAYVAAGVEDVAGGYRARRAGGAAVAGVGG